jgi:hypothetical protein
MNEGFHLYEDNHPPFGLHLHVEHDRYGQKQVFEKMRRTFMQVLPERFWVRDNFSPWGSFNIEEVKRAAATSPST